MIASHTKEAVFLYPSTHPVSTGSSEASTTDESAASSANDPLRDANKYRQFRIVEDEVQASFRRLMASTTPDMLAGTNETMMAGALSLALTYINRLSLASEDAAGGGVTGGNRTANGTRDADVTSMNARILVLSVSGDLSTQYVSMMNSIFAAQRKVRDSRYVVYGRVRGIFSSRSGILMILWWFRKSPSIFARLLAKPFFSSRLPTPLEVSTCNSSTPKAFYNT